MTPLSRFYQTATGPCPGGAGRRIRPAAVTTYVLAAVVSTAMLGTGPAFGHGPGEILKQEPPPGHLRSNEWVLVDDGECPEGLVKLVIGGSNRVYKTDVPKPGKPRERRCVRR